MEEKVSLKNIAVSFILQNPITRRAYARRILGVTPFGVRQQPDDARWRTHVRPMGEDSLYLIDVYLPQLGLDDFTLLSISDSHFNIEEDDRLDVRRRLSRSMYVVGYWKDKIDIVLYSGDVTHHGTVDELGSHHIDFLNYISTFGRSGFVLGNHDERAGMAHDIADLFVEQTGFEDLGNRVWRLEHHGMPFQVVGLKELHHYSTYAEASKAYRRVFEGAQDLPTIVVVHNDNAVNGSLSKYNIRAVIYGHTHGGEFTRFGLNGLWNLMANGAYHMVNDIYRGANVLGGAWWYNNPGFSSRMKAQLGISRKGTFNQGLSLITFYSDKEHFDQERYTDYEVVDGLTKI